MGATGHICVQCLNTVILIPWPPLCMHFWTFHRAPILRWKKGSFGAPRYTRGPQFKTGPPMVLWLTVVGVCGNSAVEPSSRILSSFFTICGRTWQDLAFIINECFIVVPLSHQQKQLVERVVGRCLFCGADTLCIESPKHGIIVNHLGIDSANQEVKQTLHQTACNILLISAGP